MMNSIRVLLIEDSKTDALLIRELLEGEKSFSCTFINASRLQDGLKLMGEDKVDVVLTDLGLPDSQGLSTFEEIHKAYPSLPIIVLTQQGDMSTALEAIQKGAQDYLIKGEFNGFLLSRSLQYAIERERLVRQLQEALDQVKTLSGFIPICAWCKNIRDDSGFWKSVEQYICSHANVDFTHGICPTCLEKMTIK